MTFYLWNQVRQHRATLHRHDLLQAVQSKLSRFLVILRKDSQCFKRQTKKFRTLCELCLCSRSLTSCLSRVGRMSSSAWWPMVAWSCSKVLAAASRTSSRGSQRAFLTVGTRDSEKTSTYSTNSIRLIMFSDVILRLPANLWFWIYKIDVEVWCKKSMLIFWPLEAL